ncbi:MAG TPA: ABC transporter permease [Candidatus Binatia bacterium]|nr:ABC transporter permease [Candidatus Binatia bacterium]
MKRYFLQRALLLLPTLLGALTLVFFLIHLVPGDPVEVMLGETASAADKDELRRSLGLHQPLMVQYKSFLSGLLQGDLGRSLYEQSSVTDLIRIRLPATIELTLCAMAIAVIISLPLAILAAINPGSGIDRGALLFSLLGLSLPNFWLGPLLMIIFSIQLGWTPVSGRGGLDHLLLPSLTLGLGMAAILTRILRGSLLQVINEDYVRTARAKGLGEKQVWLKHALRNALLSAITIMSLQFGSLLAGSIITETIFSWPGIGRLTVQAIQTRDYPLVQGCVLIIAISYLLVNFLTDVFYRAVDPRISYEK